MFLRNTVPVTLRFAEHFGFSSGLPHGTSQDIRRDVPLATVFSLLPPSGGRPQQQPNTVSQTRSLP